MNWFEVDKEGLAKLLDRRGKAFIGGELLQNAWDAPGTTRVDFTATAVAGRPLVELRVKDDSPTGFVNLAHSFTLFSESVKKSDPALRGRFNLGEKLVLALCENASIASTTGTIAFGPEGRQEFPRRKTAGGTEFRAIVRMTRDELGAMLAFVSTFIPPAEIVTTVNGTVLSGREPLREFQAPLQTELAGDDGVLRRTVRRTAIKLYEPLPDHPGRIFEMGIPVVVTGDQFDVDIQQKVPLSLERDALSPSYLRDVRAAVLSHASDLVPRDAATNAWVDDAMQDSAVSAQAVAEIVKTRFGSKVVSYDPNDREANDRAVAEGYTVLHGGNLSKVGWSKLRETGTVRPAGQVTPTPKPFDPDGEPAEHVETTPDMEAFAEFSRTLAREIMGREISVLFLKRFNASAAYGQGQLSFNVGQLGKRWFEGPLNARQLDLVLHEFGHETEGNHLSRRFSDALTKLGAKTALLALQKPHLFDLESYRQVFDDEPASLRP